MGWQFPPLYGKSKFYEKKKAKALKIVEVCNEALSKIENK